MKCDIRWHDYITVNFYWFALTTRSQVLTPLVIPLLVQRFVGEAQKGTYVGWMRLGSLTVAVLVQALAGMLSDRSRIRWGRRRPFILVGTVGEVLVLALMGFTLNLEGMTGYWVLYALYILSMAASNTAHGAAQGLIPDLVPQHMRGRFSGVKALLELPVPLIFVSFVVSKLIAAGNFWGALVALMAVLLVCMGVTMFAPERPPEEPRATFDWQPFVRLLLMTLVFGVTILVMLLLVSGVLRIGQDSPISSPTVIGVIGLAGMVLSVGLGVWFSIQIGIGREVREHPSFVWWVINRLAFMTASTNLATFMTFFLQERFVELQGEKAAGPASQAIMFVGICILLAALPSGWLADRLGKKLLVAVSGLLGGGGTFIVVLVPSLPALYAGACLIGAAVGLFYSAGWALGTDLAPQEQAGRFLGISNLAGAGAGMIGASIGGPIADSMGYVLLFTIYGVLFLLSAVPLLGVREGRAPVRCP